MFFEEDARIQAHKRRKISWLVQTRDQVTRQRMHWNENQKVENHRKHG